MEMGAEIRGMLSQAKDTWSHQKLEEAREDSPLEPSERVQPCLPLVDFGEKKNSYYFKAQSLSVVIRDGSLGNKYNR